MDYRPSIAPSPRRQTGQGYEMCEEAPHPNFVKLDLELTFLFERIKKEPIVGPLRDLSEQLQNAVDDRMGRIRKDHE